MSNLVIHIIIFIGIFSYSNQGIDINDETQEFPQSKIRSFTFLSNGNPTKGKIYLPTSYENTKDLPAIYLIDFTEQHFKIATDEFEKVIEGINQIQGVDALVVTLEQHLDVDAGPDNFQEYYAIFKHMTAYVDSNFTTNSSRTFIGRGSESGTVLMSLFLEHSETSVFDNFVATDPSVHYVTAIIELLKKVDLPTYLKTKKLHFSFSTSNDYEKCSSLINLINQAKLPWLEFESKYFINSDYESTYPIAFAEGLQFVFKK